MTKKIQVHVDGLAEMGHRFVDAWHRAEAHDVVDEAHVTFLSFQAMTVEELLWTLFYGLPV